ncbi:type II toxin-antitoxin system RelE/ParE family toxin [Undibacterium sp. Di26W]|uniref:type II toxin-antitoxin system RelE/ParE family toxin n=1 Tax=Undibacterium sp. Di26W TaxID=3413035 RepID=UPI003BF265DF
MLNLHWSIQAEDDLIAIVDYISDHSLIAAQRLKDDIEFAASQIPDHPYLYRTGSVRGTRELVVSPNYVVVYRVTSDAIDILAVIHTRQSYP